jgi:hypothetical protein
MFLDRNPAWEGFFASIESSNPGEGSDFCFGLWSGAVGEVVMHVERG